MGASLSSLVPELRDFAAELVQICGEAGLYPRVTSARRSHSDQASLYRRYQAGTWPYPVAAPGTSQHEFGEAFDMVVEPYEALKDVGKLWEQWGGVWGGRYGDPVHFGLPGPAGSYDRPSASPTVLHSIAEGVDFVLGFAPYIGAAELIAWLVSFGFPKSEVLEFIQNPVTGIVDRLQSP